MSDFAARVLKAAEEAGGPAFEDTTCYGVGCCGDFRAGVKPAVVAAFREVAGIVPPAYRLTFTAMADEIERADA
ncbi:hypothetical protein [Amycolatopsis sp. NPDC003731]